MSNSNSSLIWEIKSSFWTRSEFKGKLTEFVRSNNLLRIKYTITIQSAEYEIVAEVDDVSVDEKLSFHYEWLNNPRKKVACEMTATTGISDEINDVAKQIIFDFLGIEKFIDSTSLPYYKKGDEVRKMCEDTLRRMILEYDAVAIIMIDLDHFKDLNDNYGHSAGDSVILQLGELIIKECGDQGVAIHRSGDEFYLIVPYQNTNDVLDLSYRLRQATSQHKFEISGAEPVSLKMAQGICFVSKNSPLSFEKAAEFAEKAYNPNNEKQRDSVRIFNPDPGETPAKVADRDRAYVYICSNPTKEKELLNPYLNFISWRASKIVDLEIQDEIDEILSWLKPKADLTAGMQMLCEKRIPSLACEWSADELAFAIYYGLYRNTSIPRDNGQMLNLSFYSNGFSISLDSTILYKTESNAQPDVTYSIALRDMVPIILVQIGYNLPPLQEECFSQIIRIDARPTIGGNLPAFWEAAVAELIDTIANTPGKVFVFGKKEYGMELWNVLSNIHLWGTEPYSLSFLEKKTMQPVERIMYCKKILELDNNLSFFLENEIDKLVNSIIASLKGPPVSFEPLTESKNHKPHILKRELLHDPIKLGIADGCRVTTLGEAFPTALEIIRTCDAQPNRGEQIDQAKRKFKELTNFKIVIKDISRDFIPSYYQTEEKDFERYYNSLFENDESFFQRHLVKENQYSNVINHVAKLFQPNGAFYATRRAVLVLPHITEKQDLSPLGLVSVFISPREFTDIVYLDFSFTWRTVEAVIGLPYSLYGSAKYAIRLYNDILEAAQKINKSLPKMKIGTLSYNAYSLHMFLDDYYTNIVRGIINDASI